MRLLPKPCPHCLAEPPGALLEVDLPTDGRWRHDCQHGVWRRQRRLPSGQVAELPAVGKRCGVCGGFTHGTSSPLSGPAGCPGDPAAGLYRCPLGGPKCPGCPYWPHCSSVAAPRAVDGPDRIARARAARLPSWPPAALQVALNMLLLAGLVMIAIGILMFAISGR